MNATSVEATADQVVLLISFVGCELKQNFVWANEKQLNNRFPVTCVISILGFRKSRNANGYHTSTMEHIAHVLNRISIADPQSIKSTSHSVVTFWPTGQEIADLYTKITGKPAQIKDFTSRDRDEIRAKNETAGLAQVGYRDHWENGDWEYEIGGKSYDRTYSGPGIEEVAMRFA